MFCECGRWDIGEVGLGGEVRPVYGIVSRLKEAENMGFKTAIIPRKHSSLKNIKMDIIGVDDVGEAAKITLGI